MKHLMFALHLTLLVLGGVLVPAPAMAYVDPTAAGAALQSLYVLLGTAFMALVFLPQKLMGLFQGGKGTKAEPQPEDIETTIPQATPDEVASPHGRP